MSTRFIDANWLPQRAAWHMHIYISGARQQLLMELLKLSASAALEASVMHDRFVLGGIGPTLALGF